MLIYEFTSRVEETDEAVLQAVITQSIDWFTALRKTRISLNAPVNILVEIFEKGEEPLDEALYYILTTKCNEMSSITEKTLQEDFLGLEQFYPSILQSLVGATRTLLETMKKNPSEKEFIVSVSWYRDALTKAIAFEDAYEKILLDYPDLHDKYREKSRKIMQDIIAVVMGVVNKPLSKDTIQ